MGKACSIHGRREMHTEFQLENLSGRDHLEDMDIPVRITIMHLDKTG
jgi:hypothetical protein